MRPVLSVITTMPEFFGTLERYVILGTICHIYGHTCEVAVAEGTYVVSLIDVIAVVIESLAFHIDL